MKLYFLLIIYFNFVNVILCFTEGVYFPKKDNIIILTDYTFEEAFSEYPYLLISIYSDICQTCINYINPLFKKIYKELNNEPELRDVVSLAIIDGSSNKYFMHKYNILGYPTILLLKDGKIQSELIHRKTVDDIIIFLRKNILKPIQYFTNKYQYNRLVNNSNSYRESFITYYGKNEKEINSLKEVSYKYNNLTFINIQNFNLIHELNATEGQLSINKFFNEPRIIENPKENELWTSENIIKFIEKYNHHLLIEFGTKEGENLIYQKKNILLLINKQILTQSQIKRIEYMDKVNIKEIIMSDENKKNLKSFVELAKNVRDTIQASYIIYKKNYNYNNAKEDINKRKQRKKSIFDEDDPFGFEQKKQELKECEKRQIKLINKLDLDNDINCEIRLIDFEDKKNPKFYKLDCGEEYISFNINFIRNYHYKNMTNTNISFDLILPN